MCLLCLPAHTSDSVLEPEELPPECEIFWQHDLSAVMMPVSCQQLRVSTCQLVVLFILSAGMVSLNCNNGCCQLKVLHLGMSELCAPTLHQDMSQQYADLAA